VPELSAPDQHIDFLLARDGTVVSTGPAAEEWLAQPDALPAITALLAGHGTTDSWWAPLRPVFVRFVPMKGAGDHVLVTVVPPRPEVVEALELLSPTQQEIAEYAAAGATVGEIAAATERSPETVRSHIKEIYKRLSICTRMELQWLMRRPAISYEPGPEGGPAVKSPYET
jgi:DNA-binding CsgD family transcriptional regulator